MTSEEFFDAKYHRDADPWNFATDEYELARYATILRSLRGGTFRRAFEPGCSVGVLTRELAAVCDEVEAFDISETAVRRAQERCFGLPHVAVRHGSLPADVPAGRFDLIVFCELGYYFDAATLSQIARGLMNRLLPGGVFIATHWLGRSADHILTGDQVHDAISDVMKQSGWMELAQSQRYEGFRINQFRMDEWIRK